METNHFKTENIRILGAINIKPILLMLPQLIKEWDKKEDFELNKNKNKSLSQVKHINFRWSDKKANPVEYFDQPLWSKFKEVLLPIMIEMVKPIGYKKNFLPILKP